MADDLNDRNRRTLRDAFMGDSPGVGRDHLSHELLVAVAEGTADDVDREIAQVHVEVCAQCREDLSDLQALQAQGRATSAATRPDRAAGWSRWAAAAVILLVAAASIWMWQLFNTGPTPTSGSTSSARIVAALKDGSGEITIDDAGRVGGLGGAPDSAVAQAVTRALTTERLSLAPTLADLRQGRGVLMGAPADANAFVLTSPVATVVRSDRPTFRWQPLPGAATYVVTVYTTAFVKVAESPALKSTEWTASAAFARGSTYLWQVVATRGGEEIKSPAAPAPAARFRILERDGAAALDEIEKAYPASHIVLGVMCAEAGLVDDAERELRLALAANPESAILKSLLGQLTAAASGR